MLKRLILIILLAIFVCITGNARGISQVDGVEFLLGGQKAENLENISFIIVSEGISKVKAEKNPQLKVRIIGEIISRIKNEYLEKSMREDKPFQLAIKSRLEELNEEEKVAFVNSKVLKKVLDGAKVVYKWQADNYR